ncbi:hypothetical protein [Streptomyces sp. NPDC021562]|uniref:hypothetical protein n=1 Tax=Streptomyces sp. NPDC021562 TaxID=3155121 RepID=UPI0033CF82A9
MTQLHSTHHLSDDDFENAVFVLADEPREENGVRITAADLQLCAPVPLRLAVLLHWRTREQEGQPCSAEAIWSALTELGMYGDDGMTPVALDDVRAAVQFLLAEGLVAPGLDGAL